MAERHINDKYNFALYIPIIKYENWEIVDGKVILHFSVKDPVRRFAGWLVRKSPSSDIRFDELSSMTWLLIDENRNILEISKLINKDNKDTIEESLRKVVIFFRYLSRKGWITFKQ